MFDMTENYQFQIVIPPPFKVKFLQEENQIVKQCTTFFLGKPEKVQIDL